MSPLTWRPVSLPIKSKRRMVEFTFSSILQLKTANVAGAFGGQIRQDLILVPCPITNVAVVRPFPDQLAVFEGAIDARTEELINSYGLDLLGPPLS